MSRTDEKYLYKHLSKKERELYKSLKTISAKGLLLFKSLMRKRKIRRENEAWIREEIIRRIEINKSLNKEIK